MKTIGMIGTGIMSSGMAQNYLQAGYTVTVWNRAPAKAKPLQAAGARVVESPRAATEQSDIIFEVTANDESSRAVWEGEQGILTGATPEKILITSATLSAAWTDELAQKCQTQNLTFFDIPLTGGRVAAVGGALTLLVGGNEASLEVLRSDLAAISSKLFYFGSAGSGMRYKLILNALQATHLVAFGESMRLAKNQGLDIQRVGPALVDRPGGVLTEIGWNAYQLPDIPLTFSVDWITKDLEYARQMAGDLQVPILDDVLAAYRQVQTAGYGSKDWAAVNASQ